MRWMVRIWAVALISAWIWAWKKLMPMIEYDGLWYNFASYQFGWHYGDLGPGQYITVLMVTSGGLIMLVTTAVVVWVMNMRRTAPQRGKGRGRKQNVNKGTLYIV